MLKKSLSNLFFKRAIASLSLQAFCMIGLLVHLILYYTLHGEVEQLTVEIVRKFPHPLPAFTQGLAVVDDKIYETTGLYGESSIRVVDGATGWLVQKIPLAPVFFAEGVAVFHDRVILLTWRENRALICDPATFKVDKVLHYSGEGWGLCRDGEAVWMSNGTSTLTKRDGASFLPLQTLEVQLENSPLGYLNDLECTGNTLYANVWMKEWIVRIDKLTGQVTGIIDASSLLSSVEKGKLNRDQVLNGIAYSPKRGTFFLTGKEWPWMFEVRFISKSLLKISKPNDS